LLSIKHNFDIINKPSKNGLIYVGVTPYRGVMAVRDILFGVKDMGMDAQRDIVRERGKRGIQRMQ
jgi:hypothetical protein